MKFKVTRVSDQYDDEKPYKTVEIYTLEELVEFIKATGEDIIINNQCDEIEIIDSRIA